MSLPAGGAQKVCAKKVYVDFAAPVLRWSHGKDALAKTEREILSLEAHFRLSGHCPPPFYMTIWL